MTRTIPERKGKHALQMFDAVIAMLFIKMKDDLNIGTGTKAMPFFCQRLT